MAISGCTPSVTLAAQWKDLPCQGQKNSCPFSPFVITIRRDSGNRCRKDPELTQHVPVNLTPHSYVVARIAFPVSLEKENFAASEWPPPVSKG